MLLVVECLDNETAPHTLAGCEGPIELAGRSKSLWPDSGLQPHGERCAATEFAVNGDAPAQPFDELFADG
jgi:hypothetical protein